ncbi:Hypothetical predicted protein, partial [Marmota monax]
LDRVDRDLGHGAHLLQPPAPPGSCVTPSDGPQRHRGQTQGSDPEPRGPGLRGEAETSQRRACGAHDLRWR